MLFQVHLWIGVLVGLYVVAISLTGSLLVFERNLLDDVPQVSHPMQAGTQLFHRLPQAASGVHRITRAI